MTESLRITVAGAGIGGLATATALAQAGHNVTVAERAGEIGEVGAGIQISPNGMAVIRALGLADALGAVSLGSRAVRLADGHSGRAITVLDLRHSRTGADWRLVHRARLIEVLKTGAEEAGVRIETGREIAPPPEGAALEGDDLLVGADGLKSRVRARVDEASKPFFTRQVAWRALLQDDGDREPVAEIHLGARRHLVSYPLTGGLRNIVAVEERSAWTEEGWSHEDHPANLRAAFVRFSPRVRDWLERVGEVHLWGLYRHRVAARWSDRAQVLLGDAAHPTLPFLAQGANMALEDAWVLAECLGNLPREQALARYEALRKPRAVRVIDAASANARSYHLAFPPLRFATHGALRLAGLLAPGAVLGRFDWLYGHDVTSG